MSQYHAGFFVDSGGLFVPTVLSSDTVGTSTTRFDTIPTLQQVILSASSDPWLMLKRMDGTKVYLSEPAVGEAETLATFPESLKLAIELALGTWHDWCPDLRTRGDLMPRYFVPIPREEDVIEV